MAFDKKAYDRQFQRTRRDKNRAIAVKNYLNSVGFDHVYNIPDQLPPRTVTPRQIREAIEKVNTDDSVTEYPKALKTLENYGVAIPYELSSKVQARLVAQGQDTKGIDTINDLNDQLADLQVVKTGQVYTMDDYDDLSIGDPDQITLNGKVYTVDEMRNQIVSQFDWNADKNGGNKWPNGGSFHQMYLEMRAQVMNMTNGQIIYLYGLYDTGSLFANLTNYDSNGDGVNTKGIYDLRNIMSSVLAR